MEEKRSASKPMRVRDVMTKRPRQLDASSTAAEAAKIMRDEDIGDVLVRDGSGLCGVVTDRDIVIRAVAAGKDPEKITLGEICSRELWALSPDDSVSEAVLLMREHAVRRLPVIEDGSAAVGIVTLGDLAQTLDRTSALGDISAAPPNH
jgi:CBS domain-containing protein